MRLSGQFSKVIRASILAASLLLLGFMVSDMFAPHSEVRAQNAGVVGIYTTETTVFTAQSSSKSSGILPDNGYAQNVLNFCGTLFIGTIDLEWSPTGIAPFYPLQIATITHTDSTCHKLQVGGYYPNLRSTLTISQGTLSAWYTASAAPISYYAPAVSSSGASSVPVCDIAGTQSIATAGTAEIGSFINSGDTVILCWVSISFTGAPTGGNVQVGWAASGCTTPNYNWQTLTDASTPQTLYFPTLNLRSPLGPTVENICVNNTSGTTIQVNFAYLSTGSL